MHWRIIFFQILWCRQVAAFVSSKSTSQSLDTQRSRDSQIISSHSPHEPSKPKKLDEVNGLDLSLFDVHPELKCDQYWDVPLKNEDKIPRAFKFCCLSDPLMVDQTCLDCKFLLQR